MAIIVDNKFGNGIVYTAPIDLGAKKPLDSRIVVQTISERNAHVTENRAYPGMQIYVGADETTYIYTGKADSAGEPIFEKLGLDSTILINKVEVNNSELVPENRKVSITIKTPDGDENKGTIEVNNEKIAVKGLKSAAYTDIYNGLNKTDEGYALDARQGKSLNDRIESLEGRGRYLSVWIPKTGLPADNPPEESLIEGKYYYKSGDYFIIGVVEEGTKFKPVGSYYEVNVASTTVTEDNMSENDYYVYDGANWRFVQNTTKTVTFRQIAGQPSDNANLNTILTSKEEHTNKITAFTTENTDDTHYASAKLVKDNLDLKENSVNKITAFTTENIDDTHYPTSKLVKSNLDAKQIDILNNISGAANQILARSNDGKTLVFRDEEAIFWGDIDGTLADQTDLKDALDGKAAASHSHSVTDITDLDAHVKGIKVDAATAADTATLATKATSADRVNAIAWGKIDGTLGDQTDLKDALDGKAETSHTHVSADITDLDAHVKGIKVDAATAADTATLATKATKINSESGIGGPTQPIYILPEGDIITCNSYPTYSLVSEGDDETTCYMISKKQYKSILDRLTALENNNVYGY